MAVRDVDGLICATTRPWASVESFREARAAFDLWRKSQRRVLKVAADWADYRRWAENAVSRRAVHSRSRGDRPALVTIFLRAWARRAFGLPGGDYRGLARELTAAGWPVGVGTLKMARTRGPLCPLDHLSADDLTFAGWALARWPSFAAALPGHAGHTSPTGIPSRR